MKKAFACLLLFIAFSPAFSQTFTLTDTSFVTGDHFRVYRINFEFNKPTLRMESTPFLDSLIAFLKAYPGIVMEIQTHVDTRVSDRSHDLTKARAKSIRDYIVSGGIEIDRLKAVGYGKTKPLVKAEEIAQLKTKEAQEAAHARNRRTEFKIISL
jgi:outer membrane protein OmpA-like peptidoglycan-associated protein